MPRLNSIIFCVIFLTTLSITAKKINNKDKSKHQLNKIPNITLNYTQYLNWFKKVKTFFYKDVSFGEREQIYNENVKKINENNCLFNEGKLQNFIGLNQFTDWSDKEFNDYLKTSYTNISLPIKNETIKKKQLPLIIDYKRQGFLNSIKHGTIDSSLFATLSIIESQYFKMTGESTSLSEQFLYDCANYLLDKDVTKSVENIFEYLKNIRSLPSSDVYPLGSYKRKCELIEKTEEFEITEIKKIESKKENDIQEALVNIGPILAFVSVPPDFIDFTGGLINDKNFCNGTPNHAVTLVGYTHKSYVFRNNWGEDWGESGYFRIARKSCNFREPPVYVLVEISDSEL